MKTTFLIPIILFISFGLSNCTKDCEPVNPTCKETAPTNEMCTAYFERWFYDMNTGKCKQISYSGCSQWGFATEQDCEVCKCK